MLSKLRLFFCFLRSCSCLFVSIQEEEQVRAVRARGAVRSQPEAGWAGGAGHTRPCPAPTAARGGAQGAVAHAAALNALAAGLPSTSVCETRGVKLFTCGWPPAAVALNGPGRSSSSSTVNQLTALHPSIPWTRAAEPGFGGAGHVGRSAASAAG